MALHRKKGILSKLLGVKQETLDVWTQAIENRIKVRKEASEIYDGNIDKLLILFKRARDNGITSRELAEITGVSHGTICNWIKLLEVGNAQETQSLPPQ